MRGGGGGDKVRARLELPGDQRSGRRRSSTDGSGRAVLRAPSRHPSASAARTEHLLQLTSSQGTLHSPADAIIVSLAAALRSKHKRALILQLHQWRGKASRVGQRNRNLINVKSYQVQKKRNRSN